MKSDSRNVFALKSFFKEYFDLKKDKENENETEESIRQGVEMKGARLWILIFAIFIASLGLHINSTAVVIGAMLISPLMGPIMGIGLSVGINDIDLLRNSLKSYLVTTAFCVATSTLFFLLTPSTEAQSELLARTSPTIFDVFIALFGGLSGVVAVSTQEKKGTVIPGVAIATALMPPLCTAGYGLATGNLIYFLGAFYLYFINTVFISVATFIGIRWMHFKPKVFVDKKREEVVRKYMVVIVILTMIPAIYLTVSIIKETVFHTSASRFISEQLDFQNAQIIDRKIIYQKENKEIRVILMGEEIPETSLALAKNRLKDYKLEDTKLTVLQGVQNEELDLSSIRAMVMEEFYESSEKQLQKRIQEIDALEKELTQYKEYSTLSEVLVDEVKVLYPSIQAISIAQCLERYVDSTRVDTVTWAIFSFKEKPQEKEIESINGWLKARLKSEDVRLIIE
ncbi:MAG: TIGR00341 family protein [Bacteroidales bacterium]|nr:TIGR00341 family protein [Bacteroidales bacterium]